MPPWGLISANGNLILPVDHVRNVEVILDSILPLNPHIQIIIKKPIGPIFYHLPMLSPLLTFSSSLNESHRSHKSLQSPCDLDPIPAHHHSVLTFCLLSLHFTPWPLIVNIAGMSHPLFFLPQALFLQISELTPSPIWSLFRGHLLNEDFNDHAL